MTEALWPFSLHFYADAEIQAACLSLQDAHGGDVNVALCLLWNASRGAYLSQADVAAVGGAVEAWSGDVVQPLRAMRRRLKGAALIADEAAQQAFREKLKALELGAEKVEQQVLGALELAPERVGDPADAARHNLALYGRQLNSVITPEIVDLLVARMQVIR